MKNAGLRSTGYLLTYAQYALKFGISLRTVKRWAKMGELAGDRAPLDTPGDMRIWWARHMKMPCPAKLLAAAVAAAKEGAPKRAAGGGQPEAHGKNELKPREFRPVEDHEVGLEATLGRLREAEVQANRMMMEALSAGDEAKATLAQTMWTKLTTQVRQVEKDARNEAEAQGQLIPKAFAESRLVDLHAGIERGMRGMYRRICEVMRLTIDADSEEIWNAECDRLFSGFRSEAGVLA